MTFTGPARGKLQEGCSLNFVLRGFSEVRPALEDILERSENDEDSS